MAAWLLSIAEAMPRLGESPFEPWLVAIGLLGLGAAYAWRRRWRGWRIAVAGSAGLYIAYYALAMYVREIEPLLAILRLPQAVADAFYVTWSSPVGRLSHGEVLDAARELWRECVMPLVQLGVLAAAARPR